MIVDMTVNASPDVAVESLSDVMAVLYVVEVLSDVAVKALAVNISVEVLAGANVNVSAAVMPALDFAMSTP